MANSNLGNGNLRPETFGEIAPPMSRRDGRKDFSRPTAATPQAAEMSCYSVAEEITSICADFLVADAVPTNRSARRQIPVDSEKNWEFSAFLPFCVSR